MSAVVRKLTQRIGEKFGGPVEVWRAGPTYQASATQFCACGSVHMHVVYDADSRAAALEALLEVPSACPGPPGEKGCDE